MNVLSEANELILSVLKKFLKTEKCTCWSQYCVHTLVEDGALAFNLLTRELIHLSQEEYDCFFNLDYLKEHWFIVPEEAEEKEYADFVKWVFASRQKEPKGITTYTIFPTMDCNARCFYCFELGRSRISMNYETAKNVAHYIRGHCGGKEVKISWFGGEPLFNMPAIETICDILHRENIVFTSTMVSNGYLFDDTTVQKATNDWNVKRVQITLDGTEKVYNKIKAYIYHNVSPYGIVMNNIERLLDSGIYVTIRLNMDIYNAEDLLTLADELARRFSGKKRLRVYAHHLFRGDTPDAELHSDEEWEKRDVAMRRLNDFLSEKGLTSQGGISKNIRLNHCKADSGSAITILPNGNIGLCEHFSETELIGNIDREGFEADMVASWRERMPEIPECANCFYFPECTKLKKCPNDGSCYRQFRQEKLRTVQRQMINEYQKWQSKSDSEDEDDADFC